MPRHLETFSQCAGPNVARSHTAIGGIAGTIIGAWYGSGVLTILGGLAYLFGLILGAPPWAWSATALLLIVALIEIKTWYYNERLLCIAADECAIGTVVSEPEAAFDGDRKLNLMLAPLTQLESRLALIAHLERNRAMLENPANFTDGFHTAPPTLPAANEMSADPSKLEEYLEALHGVDPSDTGGSSNMYNQVLVGLVDTMLQPTNVNAAGEPKNFLSRFYREETGAIPDLATRDAIPADHDDAVNWQLADAHSGTSLNPMFRFLNQGTVPYLHCEVEGNYLAILLDRFILALAAFAAATFFFGPLVGLAVAVALWLLQVLFDWLTGNDGDAAEPDVDWDDPDFTGLPGITEATGDVVVTFGDWIMDTEHHQYFEIHPVRAYFLVARAAPGSDTPVLVDGNEEQVVVGSNFDPTLVNARMAQEICAIVTRAQNTDPAPTIGIAISAGLSYGLTTHYGGGGVIP